MIGKPTSGVWESGGGLGDLRVEGFEGCFSFLLFLRGGRGGGGGLGGFPKPIQAKDPQAPKPLNLGVFRVWGFWGGFEGLFRDLRVCLGFRV